MIKYISIFLISVFIASFSQILLKISADKEHKNIVREYMNFYVIVGYGLLFLSTILTISAYKGLDYKNGPIIEAVGYVYVLILSRAILKERITRNKVIGNILIIIGILIFYI